MQLSGSSADSGGWHEEQRLSYFFYILMTTRLAQREAYSRNHQRQCLYLVAKAVSGYETANGSSGVYLSRKLKGRSLSGLRMYLRAAMS